jgi:hypothetical protein
MESAFSFGTIIMALSNFTYHNKTFSIGDLALDKLTINIPKMSEKFVEHISIRTMVPEVDYSIPEPNPTVDKIKEYVEKYYSNNISLISVDHKTIKEKTHKGFTNTREFIEILSVDNDAQRGTGTKLIMEFGPNRKLTVSYEWKSPSSDNPNHLVSQDFLRFNQVISPLDGSIIQQPYYLHANVINNVFEIVENFLGENIIDWTNGKISYLSEF